MEQPVVSNLDKSLETELRTRAAQHGWSLEEEIRQILWESISRSGVEIEPVKLGLGSRIAARFAGTGLPGEIPELRGDSIEPMEWQ